jgi:hypothetical protein
VIVGFDWVQVGLRLLLSPATSHVIVRTAWYVKLHHLFLYWGGSFFRYVKVFGRLVDLKDAASSSG